MCKPQSLKHESVFSAEAEAGGKSAQIEAELKTEGTRTDAELFESRLPYLRATRVYVQVCRFKRLLCTYSYKSSTRFIAFFFLTL